jgi:hypothetical protein
MAKANSAPEFDPGSTYRIALSKPVQVGALKLRPIGQHDIRGDILNQIVAQYGPEVIVDVRPLR